MQAGERTWLPTGDPEAPSQPHTHNTKSYQAPAWGVLGTPQTTCNLPKSSRPALWEVEGGRQAKGWESFPVLPGKRPQRQLPGPCPLGRGLKPLWPGTVQQHVHIPPTATIVPSPWDLHPWQLHLWALLPALSSLRPSCSHQSPGTKAPSWDWAAWTTSP